MIRPIDRHLDSEELDALVSPRAVSSGSPGQLSEEAIREVQRHVESCQDCHRTVQMHKTVQSEISHLAVGESAPPGTACDVNVDWIQVVAGVLPEIKTKELMKHAAQCGYCGPLLRTAVGALSDDATPDEELLVAGLSTASPDWQNKMAQTLSMSGGNRQKQEDSASWLKAFSFWRHAVLATAAVALIVLAVWLGARVLRPSSPEQLLAEAYSERRTLEVRVPGARYAPLRVERSAGGSNLDKPESLLKAEALISENLRKDPNDPRWLQSRARADLLDGNYESAIKTLERALQESPDSGSLLTDLASGYYARADFTNRPLDYGNAIDALGKALARSPNDLIAIFNRAIVEEKLYLYTPAISDWKHYLELDPTGEWADEARSRLQATEEKVRIKQSSLTSPLLSAAQMQIASDQVRSNELNGRVEDYLREALESWLPDLVKASAGKRPEYHTNAPLIALANVLRTVHEDLWLSDLLGGPQGPNFDKAVLALSSALKANDYGDYSGAQIAARNAGRLFRASGNVAAELRANEEEVYADHLLYDGPTCTALAKDILSRLGSLKYEWLRAQINLEESNCLDLMGDPGQSKRALDFGARLAKERAFSELYLRGLGFQADAAASFGDSQGGFSLASGGLGLFWSSQVGVMKGYNLYTDLDTAADILRLPYLQVALWSEATCLIDLHPDIVQRAMAHRWYGNAAYLAEMPELARQEFSKASSLFSSAPPTEATLRGKLDADIWLAGLATRTGDFKRASSILTRVEGNLQNAPGFAQEISFYTAKAQLNLRERNLNGCEVALRSALFLAEGARKSLSSESARQQWAQQTANSYLTLVAWKIQQGDANVALEYWEWYKGAGVRIPNSQGSESYSQSGGHANASESLDAPAIPLPTVVAQQLPILQDRTIITYAVLPDGIASWMFDDRGISTQWAAKSKRELEETTNRFLRLCADRDSDAAALRSSARELYDVLIAPFERRLTGNRILIIEPDGPLSNVPFEALVDNQGHYLLERASILVSPGLYESMRARPALAIRRSTPALVVSVPALDDGSLTPVTGAHTEAEEIARQFNSSRKLEGSTASLAEILRYIPDANVFHFAGHAISSSESNGLLLNEQDTRTLRPRLLNAETVRPGQLGKLQLAVLSACATGTGLEPGASGTQSLSTAMLRAGVPHVVASRWNVDSEATRFLMNVFYSELLAGRDVAGSMRLAEITMASRPGMAHPYYWASFEVQGI